MLYSLPNCVRAIAHALQPAFDAEIVVADFHSDDWPLAHWIHVMASPVPVRVIPVDGDFSVGRGFNIAADNAASDRLLFLGADMLVSTPLIEEGHRCLDVDTVYFPLVWSYTNPEHTEGEDRPYGRGNVFMTKAMRVELGPWREFKSHGKSDDVMWQRAVTSGLEAKCERGADFFHQWHPNDKAWKNQNYPKGWEAADAEKEAAYKAHNL
jgi:glycosyltransferase involved in cell wall biosynthesis